ncbi:PhzF family phenazine biosynthesis protein [Glycomyces paridis]|uniref:PhzF family phenazine biosynthesis protein n=1 Tax=Glycomyces paridis TaxID=2126555 RepID=A0A4S8P7F2_9ACTN|nr:PhzF family phenazine biosynthesis isomerase [Glycomyces paridis]THV26193.1 PhzF family phenazine biosynthesis protein [Glycomyces paridis]
MTRGNEVQIVHACTRGDTGGSPTAVCADGDYGDEQRRALPGTAGTSHAVFVRERADGSIGLRFFTAAGELPACGHGTVAALALHAHRTGTSRWRVRAGGRVFEGRCENEHGRLHASFHAGPVTLRDPDPRTTAAVAAALGTGPIRPRVAGIGRERLLVPLDDTDALAALAPDFDALRRACDAAGLLGCFTWAPAKGQSRYGARMFAPSIGVPEDAANANSTACLAAHLDAAITVDMGDALARPSTVTAAPAPHGAVRIGGTARIGDAPATLRWRP